MITTFSRIRTVGLLFCLCVASDACRGQGLSPRAYVITPIHSNAVVLTYTLEDGGVVFDQIVPTPTAGNVYILIAQQVQPLDVPVAAAIRCIMQLGVGAGKFLNPAFAKVGKPAPIRT
jgi:hypothetical protein